MATFDPVRLQHDLAAACHAGIDAAGIDTLAAYADSPVADRMKSLADADADEAVWPMLDLMADATLMQADQVGIGAEGELREIEAGPHWATPMLTQAVYAMVPESRPFAKRVKPDEQVMVLESTLNDGTITDLRLVQIYLKSLTAKEETPVTKAMISLALPSFGKDILPDLWPSLSPQSKSFEIAYKIDMQATLAKLQEKGGGKKTDRGGPVIEAVNKLLEKTKDQYGVISADSLPILKLGLKMAPESGFRRKVAEILAGMGEKAVSALPEMIDAFERGGLGRDYNLIQPMVALGKNSPDVAQALMRALEDRDSSVRLFAAFNIGQMGELAFGAIGSLEFMAASDPDQKVRDRATQTLNKLKAKLEPALAAE